MKNLVFGMVVLAGSCAYGHICPNGNNTFVNTHDASRKSLTRKEADALRKQSNAMISAKAATPNGGSQPDRPLTTHDAPIIITEGSVRIGFGYQPEQDGASITRHGCPGDHIMEVTTWIKGKAISKRYQFSDKQPVNLWVDAKAENKGPFNVSNFNQSPHMMLKLNASATWKLDGNNRTKNIFQKAANSEFLYADKSTTTGNFRLGLIQAGDNPPVVMRGACYKIQIFHALAKPNDGSDGEPLNMADPTNWPACATTNGTGSKDAQ